MEPVQPQAPAEGEVVPPPVAVEKAETAPDPDSSGADNDAAKGDLATNDGPAAVHEKRETPEANAPEPETPADEPVVTADEVVATPAPQRGRASNDPRELRKTAAQDTSASEAAAD